jgi:hypothetical protein
VSHQRQFIRRLDRLYVRRTGWLRTILTRNNPGPAISLTKRHRENAIKELQAIASYALSRKLAKREFKRSVARKKTWMAKDRGKDAKLKNFRSWARKRIDKESGKVYVFWHKKKCLYVGRTGGKGSRPSHQFKKDWFKATTRITVYMAPRKSSIPRLECLAVHRFLPSRNKIKVSKEKWTPRCPLCRLHREIKTELRTIFRFN